MSGFEQQAIQFFQELNENNNREWFLEHKQSYIEHVQEPAIEFVVDLGGKLQTIVPNIQFDTITSGSGSIMRIYRDTRFSKDKTPYKNWLGIRFWEGIDRKNCASRFFFYLNGTGAGIYVGSHHFDKKQLLAYQAAVDDKKKGAQLEKIITSLSKQYEIGGTSYKRVPKQFSADHVRGDLLKHKAMFAHCGDISPTDTTSAQLTDIVLHHFEALSPLHRWMCDNTQP